MSYRRTTIIVVTALLVTIASVGARTHFNLAVPPSDVISSLLQWDFVRCNEELCLDAHKTKRGVLSFHYVFDGHIPDCEDIKSDTAEVVEKTASATSETAAYGSGTDDLLIDSSNSLYQLVEEEDEEDAEAETSSEMVVPSNDRNEHPNNSPLSNDTPSSADIVAASLADEDANDRGMNVRSPMESLKAIWRRLIEAPPSATEIQQILLGAPYYTSSQRPTSYNRAIPVVARTSNSTVDRMTEHAKAPTAASQFSHANPLRANGTDRESMYRQILSQFLEPLSAAQGKRAQWLDQELALRLKAAVVIAHQPELWRGIGEGLKPQLVRGIRLVTPVDETAAPGKLN